MIRPNWINCYDPFPLLLRPGLAPGSRPIECFVGLQHPQSRGPGLRRGELGWVMRMTDRLHLFDTTLRDGQQTQGVQFSTAEKLTIATALDALGIDYIEGGWPGANPTDSEFFAQVPQTRATMTAFGMTKRSGRSAENDDVLAAVINASTPAVCLVGKAHPFHVTTALNISLDENLANIRASIAHLAAQNREAMLDAEHFFDGYKADPGYAVQCLQTALEAGARWVVLCDTNGGTLPADVGRITSAVIASGVPGEKLGIHCHDDTGNAVANSLAAIDAGARQVQGTLNGLGERCGNANLVTLIPTLLLKEPYASQFTTGVSRDALADITRVSRMLDDILNRVPQRAAPYVGASAFAHKAGLHASAILKDPTTYEHVPPETVGNARVIPMSNQAGQSNLRMRLHAAGIAVDPKDPALGRILEVIKDREDQGYAYDGAQASFELVARNELGLNPDFFEVKRYRVTVERRKNKYNRMISLSEAVVVVKIGDQKMLSVSESMDEEGTDRGPVNALAKALAKDLGPYQAVIDDLRLVDFKVRITQGGTEAVTRVIIDSEDAQGRRWSTVGVSANIVDASFEALLDAIQWKLIRDVGAPA
jgi:2-isopropylmalate synthase